MSHMTILDAVLVVLGADEAGISAKEIHDRIVDRARLTFRARDPVAMVRATAQKHLRMHGNSGQPVPCLRKVEHGRYSVKWQSCLRNDYL